MRTRRAIIHINSNPLKTKAAFIWKTLNWFAGHQLQTTNSRIYNRSSGPHITHFLAVVGMELFMEWSCLEGIFWRYSTCSMQYFADLLWPVVERAFTKNSKNTGT